MHKDTFQCNKRFYMCKQMPQAGEHSCKSSRTDCYHQVFKKHTCKHSHVYFAPVYRLQHSQMLMDLLTWAAIKQTNSELCAKYVILINGAKGASPYFYS